MLIFNQTEYLPYLLWWVKKDRRGNYSVAMGKPENYTGFRIYNVKTDEELKRKLEQRYESLSTRPI